MSKVKVYCTQACPYCQMALRLLDKKGAEVEEIRVDLQPELRDEMTNITGRTTVPQIFIGEHHVGGYTELAELDMEDELEPLLNA